MLTLTAPNADQTDLLMQDWIEAELTAVAAYRRWARDHDAASYAVYRACADQADAAQDVLAMAAGA
jgi:hypothetical protein